MFEPKIKIDRALYNQARIIADAAGYSSVDEFLIHIIEREVAKFEDSDSQEEIKKRMQGLGYIS